MLSRRAPKRSSPSGHTCTSIRIGSNEASTRIPIRGIIQRVKDTDQCRCHKVSGGSGSTADAGRSADEGNTADESEVHRELSWIWTRTRRRLADMIVKSDYKMLYALSGEEQGKADRWSERFTLLLEEMRRIRFSFSKVGQSSGP
ncbi:hypothetical protein Hypma_004686, partial [Hypsizygus marmoreus]